MERPINIGAKKIGAGLPVYIVAELSANHQQDRREAVALVQAAADAGADAVKLQTYTADTLTIDCNADCFKIHGTIWDGRSLYDLYKEAYTPWEWYPLLRETAGSLGVDLFSSPFDATAVDFLENNGCPAYKVASFELVDIPLIRKIARNNKPVIMSTGMATLEEIGEAVKAIKGEGNAQIVLLKCTSAYPALPEDMNLRTIPDMASRFGVPVGVSDHTQGISVPVAAVAVGACVVEKHFTLSRGNGGPDAAFSLEPGEFRAMVDAVRIAEKALGCINYEIVEKEKASRILRRSLFVVEDVRAGDEFSARNVRSIRPGHGLPPRFMKEILGRKANKDIKRGTPLSWDVIL